jgi:hypothetical protein
VSDLQFEGQSFALATKVGLMPLMRFAHLAQKGIDAADMDGLVAIYDLLRNVIADEDWGRFEEHASVTRADGDDLLEVVKQAMAAISERPTDRPSDSSDGPQATSDSSADVSSSPVIHRLEQEGRPSIALMVQQAQEQGSRASA